MRSEIEGKILRLAYPTICNTLFLELCPCYSNQPHAALDHIRQVHHDRDGNQVVSTVQAYFQQLMNASRPFSSQREFPISVCQKFQDGLDPASLPGFASSFRITVSCNHSPRRTRGRYFSRCFRQLNRQRTNMLRCSASRVRQLVCPRLSLLAPPQVDLLTPLHFRAKRRPR